MSFCFVKENKLATKLKFLMKEQMSHLFRGSYSILFYFYKIHINTKSFLFIMCYCPITRFNFIRFKQNKTKHNSLQWHQQEYHILGQSRRKLPCYHKRPYSVHKKNSFQLLHHQCLIDRSQHTKLPKRLQ
jgi:hypothetical protein